MNALIMRSILLACTVFCMVVFIGCDKDTTTVPPVDNTNPGSQSIKVIQDEFEGVPLVVVGSEGWNLLVAFQSTLNGQQLTLQAVQDAFPVMMEDQLGNRYDMFGTVRSGPDAGSQLETVNSGMGYWFVFGAMYPGLEILGEGSRDVSIDLENTEGWGVSTTLVAQGSGFDAIQALETAEFSPVDNLPNDPENPFYLVNEDLVIVVSINGETKAYPHIILDWHEIINDVVGGVPVSVTYCPLTGTAKVWERSGNSPNFSFGVSGLLYNSNVLPFDRETESFWTQLEGECVYGDRLGQQLSIVPSVETTWGSLKLVGISAMIMTENTGIARDYRQYPYGNYKTSNLISYPVAFNDDRLHSKERVFSILINGKAKAYRLTSF